MDKVKGLCGPSPWSTEHNNKINEMANKMVREMYRKLNDAMENPGAEVALFPVIKSDKILNISLELNKRCEHNWKDYHGFNETFRYCTKCDEKDKA